MAILVLFILRVTLIENVEDEKIINILLHPFPKDERENSLLIILSRVVSTFNKSLQISVYYEIPKETAFGLVIDGFGNSLLLLSVEVHVLRIWFRVVAFFFAKVSLKTTSCQFVVELRRQWFAASFYYINRI